MEYGGSGGDNDFSSDTHPRKKRYHRHTANQIQTLEAMFKDCPHPDEKQRLQLSRELGLAPRQIKFWFQNRRTQMKAQHERADNGALRAENDKIRCENIAIREALKNVICPSCTGPSLHEDPYFDEQKLRIENARLKEELDRVSGIATKYIGRPISQLPPIQPPHFSSLELSMSSFTTQEIGCPSLDLDLLPGSSSSVQYHHPILVSEVDKSLMTEIARNAMGELLRLSQTNEPLWIKSPTNGRDVLDLESYEQAFPRPNSHLKNIHIRREASRDSGVVIINSAALIDMFMDSNKWVELFPTIVSMARTIEIITSGMLGSHSGCLQLMYGELQVLSPLVPSRQFYFLRYCEQIEEGVWAVVDVSYDLPRESQRGVSLSQCHRFPSGCIIQEMPNGYSKVSWVEHVEVEDKGSTHWLFRDLIHSGLAFGAQRWLSTLQRMCERFACLMVTASSTRDLGGVIPSSDGKRSMMKLAQRMVNNFCGCISTSHGHRWTTLSGTNEVGVRVTVHKSTDPNGVVLSAATTIWLPVPPQTVFDFFKNDRTRSQWDVLSDGNAVQEVAHIANGSHPGNCISVLRGMNTNQNNNNMLILQESCIEEGGGAMVVYCPVDVAAMNMAMSGEDPSCIPLLPSGFTILPDGKPADGARASSSTAGAAAAAFGSSRSDGCLVTVAFQIMVSSLPSGKLNLESVSTVNNLITTTLHQIKHALNCHT